MILTKPQGPGKTILQLWERQLFARMRRNTKTQNLLFYALPLPYDYDRCGGGYNGMDLEDPVQLQEAADEMIMQIGEDVVLQLSDEECANGRLMLKKLRELFMEAENIQIYRPEKVSYRMVPRWNIGVKVLMCTWTASLMYATGILFYHAGYISGITAGIATVLPRLSQKRSWF